ncbi:MAG: TIGR00645 family protein [Gammaproteobacteria bacterium]
MKRIERFLELLIFNSRWLLAPFYIGLVAAIAMLLVKFLQEFLHIVPHLFTSTESEIVLAILTLVDMSLVANLLLIIIFSGYENFVSRIDTAGHEDRPAWMGKVDFSGLKVKLIGSIVAISAIELLKAFVNVAALTTEQLMWKVIIHVVLVSSGLLFAIMDHIAERTGQGKEGRGQSEQAGHKGL